MRNARATYPQDGNSPAKAGVIPNVVASRMWGSLKVGIRKDLPLGDGPVSHQLVGGVTAHQGDDG